MKCVICGKELVRNQKKTCSWKCRGKYSRSFVKTPWNKGKKMSKEFCKKISVSHKGKHYSPKTELTSARVKKMWQDPEHKKSVSEKISKANKGRKFSIETRKKMSKAQTGVVKPRGKDSPSWKKDDLTYTGVHARIRREFGEAIICEHCGTTTAKRYDWANKDHKYSLDKKDWMQLCRGCHQKYDYKMGFRKR